MVTSNYSLDEKYIKLINQTSMIDNGVVSNSNEVESIKCNQLYIGDVKITGEMFNSLIAKINDIENNLMLEKEFPDLTRYRLEYERAILDVKLYKILTSTESN